MLRRKYEPRSASEATALESNRQLDIEYDEVRRLRALKGFAFKFNGDIGHVFYAVTKPDMSGSHTFVFGCVPYKSDFDLSIPAGGYMRFDITMSKEGKVTSAKTKGAGVIDGSQQALDFVRKTFGDIVKHHLAQRANQKMASEADKLWEKFFPAQVASESPPADRLPKLK